MLPGAEPTPSAAQCRALWNKYEVPEHIRIHSERVARFALELAERAAARGYAVDPPAVHASGLLHDLAKSYTITHGGSHAQLGAAWTIAETGCRGIAQGILHHVHWPWPVEEENICTLPFFLMYADKRTLHTGYVTLRERFADLQQRYGVSGQARGAINSSHEQALNIEQALSARLEMKLDAHTPDSGRLVE